MQLLLLSAYLLASSVCAGSQKAKQSVTANVDFQMANGNKN